MSTEYKLMKIVLNTTLKTPLVSLLLALMTILLLYIVASQMKVGVYESISGEIEYFDGKAVISAITSEQTANKNIIKSIFYETSSADRYSCKYVGKEKTADSYTLQFLVDDEKYLIATRGAHKVHVEIKTGSISMVDKLFFNRGK